MSPQYLTTEHIQTFLYQILCATKWIHSFSVFHRDLKPANILLNEDCSLKVSHVKSLGLGCITTTVCTRATESCSTLLVGIYL
jgi:serine/threonine protein kinase